VERNVETRLLDLMSAGSQRRISHDYRVSDWYHGRSTGREFGL